VKPNAQSPTAAPAGQIARLAEAQRAYREFHVECFWSFDPNLVITLDRIGWVIEQLRRNGNAAAWSAAASLCR
jgi:hypothetical protein